LLSRPCPDPATLTPHIYTLSLHDALTIFYLSDHVLKMHKKSKADAYVEVKKAEMSPEEVSKVLLKAFGENRVVSVQMSVLNKEGDLFRSFQGHVLGVDEDKVMIDDHIVDIEDINHVEIIRI